MTPTDGPSAGLPSWVTGTQLLDNGVLELSSGLLFIAVGLAVIESEGEPEEAAAVAVADCRCGARSTMGNCTGEPSNSAQPPRKPISTTRSRIRDSWSFLERNEKCEVSMCHSHACKKKKVHCNNKGRAPIMMTIESIQQLTSAFLRFVPPQIAPPRY